MSKMMIVVRHDLKMRKGKIAAQSGHACVEVTLKALAKEKRLSDITVCPNGEITLTAKEKPTALTDWFQSGTAKVCVYVNSLEELLAVNARAEQEGLLTALIMDAGCTEFHGVPTYTCLAIEPAESEDVDPITGQLPLY